MANKSGSNGKELAVVDFSPINPVPDVAPAPQMDLTSPTLSYDDVLPSNFFSMEDLQIWLEERGAESRVLTVAGASVEFVYDPEKGETTGDWKPCLSFVETGTMLVINKTRGQQLKRLAKSPFMRDWARVGRIAIKPGIGNGKAQIVIAAVPEDAAADLADLNKELFD